MLKKIVIIISLLTATLLAVSCAPDSLDRSLDSIVGTWRFNTLAWEWEQLLGETEGRLLGGRTVSAEETEVVQRYFLLVGQTRNLQSAMNAVTIGNQPGDAVRLRSDWERLEREKTAMKARVEDIIANQIAESLTEQGIYHPFEQYLGWQFSFPPINFRLEKPPYLLIISPRDQILSWKQVSLNSALTEEEREAIEAQTDRLGVSSLVEELGGLGATYPTFVAQDASLRFTINTATHEWLHQYLAFKPAGFAYVLSLTGLSPNREVATLNETLAGMFSEEVTRLVLEKYYPEEAKPTARPKPPTSGFDFNREMREIRKTVDEYLARGQVEEAEAYMELKRQYLASQGYYIRKLNQAYFAFHGRYADGPTSINPIGREMRELRRQSTSLKSFLDTAAQIISRPELQSRLKPSSNNS
ncbi:MAG: hypothetical protein V1849_04640 [Chloroflexota bacterium]